VAVSSPVLACGWLHFDVWCWREGVKGEQLPCFGVPDIVSVARRKGGRRTVLLSVKGAVF
jgi:hypothetical protein